MESVHCNEVWRKGRTHPLPCCLIQVGKHPLSLDVSIDGCRAVDLGKMAACVLHSHAIYVAAPVERRPCCESEFAILGTVPRVDDDTQACFWKANTAAGGIRSKSNTSTSNSESS